MRCISQDIFVGLPNFKDRRGKRFSGEVHFDKLRQISRNPGDMLGYIKAIAIKIWLGGEQLAETVDR